MKNKRIKLGGRPKSERPRVDLGTPELIAKREAVLGESPAGWPKLSVALAEHPLGVLMWRGQLDQKYDTARDMYWAGMRFGAIWGRVFKHPFAQSMMAHLLPSEGGEWTEEKLADAESELNTIRAALNGRQAYDALVNCVIYRRINLQRIGRVRVALTTLMNMRPAQTKAA